MFQITSTAFREQEEIPASHTCEGKDISPALEWASVPEGTQSLALIVDDPDAPDPEAPKMVWVHWVLFNLPADSQALPEGVSSDALPEGTREGLNDWKENGWRGPCPPVGKHRYFFRLFALDCRLDEQRNVDRARLDQMMQGHILEEAVLMGTYEKKHA